MFHINDQAHFRDNNGDRTVSDKQNGLALKKGWRRVVNYLYVREGKSVRALAVRFLENTDEKIGLQSDTPLTRQMVPYHSMRSAKTVSKFCSGVLLLVPTVCDVLFQIRLT